MEKLLLAVKIIGNEGSHIGEIMLEDILDAYEILEVLIEHTYVNNQKEFYKLQMKLLLKTNHLQAGLQLLH